MKKLISLVLALAVILTMTVNVFAASKADVLTALRAPIVSNSNGTRALPEVLLVAAEKHLDMANYSSAELDVILAYINQGRAMLEDEFDVIGLAQMTSAELNKFIRLVDRAATATDVSVKIIGSKLTVKSLITGQRVTVDLDPVLDGTIVGDGSVEVGADNSSNHRPPVKDDDTSTTPGGPSSGKPIQPTGANVTALSIAACALVLAAASGVLVARKSK